jgi:environmental stress-induced protein Ves
MIRRQRSGRMQEREASEFVGETDLLAKLGTKASSHFTPMVNRQSSKDSVQQGDVVQTTHHERGTRTVETISQNNMLSKKSEETIISNDFAGNDSACTKLHTSEESKHIPVVRTGSIVLVV